MNQRLHNDKWNLNWFTYCKHNSIFSRLVEILNILVFSRIYYIFFRFCLCFFCHSKDLNNAKLKVFDLIKFQRKRNMGTKNLNCEKILCVKAKAKKKYTNWTFALYYKPCPNKKTWILLTFMIILWSNYFFHSIKLNRYTWKTEW